MSDNETQMREPGCRCLTCVIEKLTASVERLEKTLATNERNASLRASPFGPFGGLFR